MIINTFNYECNDNYNNDDKNILICLLYFILLFQVVMKDCNEEISITYANCTCPIGVSGSCGHVTGTLYQIAKFKHLKQRVIPADAASTSLPQTWHAPRGQKIGCTTVDNLEVRGY